MKKVIFASMVLAAAGVSAETDIVPLDVEKGYWESNTELVFNKAMDDMLANLPKAQRAAMEKMMASQTTIPTVKTCITSESYNDFDKQFKESMGDAEGCELSLKESTGESFVGQYDCDNITAEFSIDVESPKRHVTNVVTTVNGEIESKIQVVAEWKGVDCPADALK